MNVVEAIDAWIDDRIDDLSDAELEEILDFLDLIADSEFADLDADVVDDDDIDDMVALVDGDDEQINYAHWVFSSALIGEEDLGAGYLDARADDSDQNGPRADDFDSHADDPDDLATTYDTAFAGGTSPDDLATTYDTAFAGGTSPDDLEPAHVDPDGNDDAVDPDDLEPAHVDPDDLEPAHVDPDGNDDAVGVDDDGYGDSDDDDESVFARFDREIRAAVGGDVDPTDEPDGFRNDRERAPEPIVLLPAADGLGPSFLPPIDAAPQAPVRNDGWKRWTVASLIIAGLAVFAYGTVQLFDSLDETSVAATSTTTTTQGASDEAPSPLSSNDGDATAGDATAASQESTDAIKAVPEIGQPAQTAIVLSDGSIVLATLNSPDGATPTEFAMVYEPNPDENLGAALRASWSGDELGVVDSAGNVHIIDPAADDLSTIYVPGDDLAPAIAIATSGPRVAILTNEGSIWLMKKTDTASADTLTELWDAEEEEAQVTSIIAVSDQLAFTLDTGAAKLMDIASSRNPITDLWSSTGDTPAPRIESGPNDTLLWIWEGAISRYRLDAGDDARVEVVWDPSTVDEKSAIRFSPAGERFAVILQDGGLVLATENGAAQKLWDPVETELRAQAISASADEIIMLLETGSVLRLALDADPPRLDAVWDVTDETLSPARQVAIKP